MEAPAAEVGRSGGELGALLSGTRREALALVRPKGGVSFRPPVISPANKNGSAQILLQFCKVSFHF